MENKIIKLSNDLYDQLPTNETEANPLVEVIKDHCKKFVELAQEQSKQPTVDWDEIQKDN